MDLHDKFLQWVLKISAPMLKLQVFFFFVLMNYIRSFSTFDTGTNKAQMNRNKLKSFRGKKEKVKNYNNLVAQLCTHFK